MSGLEYTEQWHTYSDIIIKNVFDCITEDSRVLEIGPYGGWFSDLILQKNPAYLELVESNNDAIDVLTNKYNNMSNVKIIHADIFDILKKSTLHSFDVVVAFGVLYHWHSPLEFLEQLSNQIDPAYVCIDNIDAPMLYMSDEELNSSGNRYITSVKKTVDLSLTLPGPIISKAMKNLGYNEIYYRQMADIQLRNKEHFNVWKFQRK